MHCVLGNLPIFHHLVSYPKSVWEPIPGMPTTVSPLNIWMYNQSLPFPHVAQVSQGRSDVPLLNCLLLEENPLFKPCWSNSCSCSKDRRCGEWAAAANTLRSMSCWSPGQASCEARHQNIPCAHFSDLAWRPVVWVSSRSSSPSSALQPPKPMSSPTDLLSIRSWVSSDIIWSSTHVFSILWYSSAQGWGVNLSKGLSPTGSGRRSTAPSKAECHCSLCRFAPFHLLWKYPRYRRGTSGKVKLHILGWYLGTRQIHMCLENHQTR